MLLKMFNGLVFFLQCQVFQFQAILSSVWYKLYFLGKLLFFLCHTSATKWLTMTTTPDFKSKING